MENIFSYFASDPAALATIIGAIIGLIGTITAALIRYPEAFEALLNSLISISKFVAIGATVIALIWGSVSVFNKLYSSSDNKGGQKFQFRGSIPTPLPTIEAQAGGTKVNIDTTQQEIASGVMVTVGETYQVDFGGCWTINRFVIPGAGDHNPADECVPPEGHPAWPFPMDYDGTLARMGTGLKFGHNGEIIQTSRHMEITIKPAWLKGKTTAELIIIINDNNVGDNGPGANGPYHVRITRID